MTKKASKPAPVISELDTSHRDGDVLAHQFDVGGVRVQVFPTSDIDTATAADLAAKLHALAPLLVAPPPRSEVWGEGQFDHVKLGPGVEAALRITKGGRVRMLVPGGDLDVTDGTFALGTGLHEAGARAAQIRAQLVERATTKAERLGHDPVWEGLRGTCWCRRCEATGEIGHDGKARGAVFAEACRPVEASR